MIKYLGFLAIIAFVAAVAAGTAGCGGGGSSSSSSSGGTTGGPHPPPGTTIEGRIIREGSTIGVPGIRVLFYTAADAQIAQATTDNDGWFYSNVGVNAVKFHLDPASIPSSNTSGFLRMYRYNLKWYSAIEPTCKATLPPIVLGNVTEIPNDPIQLRLFNGVPPFPDGCGP